MSKTKVFTINLGGSNSYLVKGEDGCILVDTGMKGAGKKLTNELKRIKISPDEIKLIIITHDHYDHTGGLSEIKKIIQAPVAMNKSAVNTTYGHKNQSTPFFKIFVKAVSSITPSRKIKAAAAGLDAYDGMDLGEYGVAAKIYHVPGHTEDSICIVTSDGECLIGDTLFNMFPGTHYPIIVYDRDKLAESYIKLDKLNCSVYYPGHGKPISQDIFKKKIMGRASYFKSEVVDEP